MCLTTIGYFGNRHDKIKYWKQIKKSMFKRSDSLEKLDPAIWKQIVNENKRQEEHIELIASENYTLPAVMEAQGSQLTNKYA